MSAVPSGRPLFCIVDPNLKDFVGHHYEYDRATASAAAMEGYVPIILAHRETLSQIAAENDVRPIFSKTIWDGASADAALLTTEAMSCNRQFYEELIAGLLNVRLAHDTVIFGHMITERQLLGWAWFARYIRRSGARLVLLLRYQASFYAGELCAQAFRILEKCARRGSVHLTSDSARLARQISQFTKLPIDEVPIPHTAGPAGAQTVQPGMRGSGKLRFVSLGNARDEKGFIEILEAIRILRLTGSAENCEFVLQANDAEHEIQTLIDRFAELHLPGVELIHTALDSQAYRGLLESADIVLLPYWHSIYEARTSGVFLEAVTAGKPVICTRNTWMTDQLRLGGAGLECNDRDVGQLTKAILRACDEYAALLRRAIAASPAYLARHNAIALVRQLRSGLAQSVQRTGPTRIAILYPWGDARSGKSGASLRVNLLARYLEECGAEIRLLQPGYDSGSLARAVSVESCGTETSLQQIVRGYFDWACRNAGMNKAGASFFWWHVAPLLDRGFRHRVLELVRWADVVLLEYTFWFSAVAEPLRQCRRRCIVTDYDIVSDQVRSPVLRWLTRKLEFRAMAHADNAVCVSPADRDRLTRAGISCVVIANPIDFTALSQRLPVEASDAVRVLYSLPKASEFSCLFVGSAHEPNRIAAERCHAIARDMATTYPGYNVRFVVVGGCATAERDGNYQAFGMVDECVLRTLYESASLVLVPLPSGTGSSLKTIEAFAAGKVTLGTTVAFRGLQVTDGQECIIENRLDAYAGTIAELLDDPERRISIAESAKRYARAYDYRCVFSQYEPLIGRSLGPVPAWAPDNDAIELPLALLREIASKALQCDEVEIGERFARQLVAADDGDCSAHLLLAELLAKQQDSEALVELDIAESLGADSAAILFARYKFYRSVGDDQNVAKAEAEVIDQQIRTSEFDPELRKFRAHVWPLFHSGETAYVLNACMALRDRLPERRHADVSYLIGQCLHKLDREPERAVSFYDEAMELGFDEFWTRFQRGSLSYKVGRIDESVSDLERAWELRPRDDEVRNLLLSVVVQLMWRDFSVGKFEAALEIITPWLKRYPQDPRLHYFSAQCLHNLKRDLTAARWHYNEALKLGFDNEFWVRCNLGRLSLDQDDPTSALVELERAVVLDSGHSVGLAHLAEARARLGTAARVSSDLT